MNQQLFDSPVSQAGESHLDELTRLLRIAEALTRLRTCERNAYMDFTMLGASPELAMGWVLGVTEAGCPKFGGHLKKLQEARAAFALAVNRPDYVHGVTPSHNLISKIRWGTDDEKSDLAFYLNRFFGL